jgi:hydroxymethylglutaryl-CoA lyase
MGLANVLAAIDAGVTRFDASLGGIGGCPYAPGASGNVATEDVVHMLACEGHETGVDLNGLILAAAELERLVGHALTSQVVRSGPRLKLHSPPAGFDEIRARATKMAEGGAAAARKQGDTRIG